MISVDIVVQLNLRALWGMNLAMASDLIIIDTISAPLIMECHQAQELHASCPKGLILTCPLGLRMAEIMKIFMSPCPIMECIYLLHASCQGKSHLESMKAIRWAAAITSYSHGLTMDYMGCHQKCQAPN